MGLKKVIDRKYSMESNREVCFLSLSLGKKLALQGLVPGYHAYFMVFEVH